jgi:hypothetical protein
MHPRRSLGVFDLHDAPVLPAGVMIVPSEALARTAVIISGGACYLTLPCRVQHPIPAVVPVGEERSQN